MLVVLVVLAIGIVVDDAIAVVENASRHLADGLSSKNAAVKALSEITGPVIATTLVLLAVFVPTAFMPGITGQLFQQFALTISAAVMIAYVVLVAATGWALLRLPTGFVPEEDQGYLFVNLQLPDAASQQRTAAVMERLDPFIIDRRCT